MRKIFINLFAIPAILFAVLSAFTNTGIKFFAPDRYKIFIMVPDQVSSSFCTFAQVTNGSNIFHILYDQASEINNVPPSTGDWLTELCYTEGSSNVPGLTYPMGMNKYLCDATDTDQLCSAYVRVDHDGSWPNNAILAVVAGDGSFAAF